MQDTRLPERINLTNAYQGALKQETHPSFSPLHMSYPDHVTVQVQAAVFVQNFIAGDVGLYQARTRENNEEDCYLQRRHARHHAAPWFGWGQATNKEHLQRWWVKRVSGRAPVCRPVLFAHCLVPRYDAGLLLPHTVIKHEPSCPTQHFWCAQHMPGTALIARARKTLLEVLSTHPHLWNLGCKVVLPIDEWGQLLQVLASPQHETAPVGVAKLFPRLS